MRASGLVGATLGDVQGDEWGDHWLYVTGKGGKRARVALPSLARSALDQYLVQRWLTVTPQRWVPRTPLVASLGEDGDAGIVGRRLWHIMRRFFGQAADVIQSDHPAVAENRAVQAPAGCAIAMQVTPSRAERNSPRCATTCATRRSPRLRCTCMATISSGRGK
ncbi:hypothetical protein BGL_2c15210 [Burkholderia plantarii]|uniref:Uncharacterized protein n=1 Tax=Burkholderia plantarii TaxID=41899 RepID=A0A0B6S1P5_BURPL|nr:hypothetical protein BGL_2c15210 [Burkholderia plantarii]